MDHISSKDRNISEKYYAFFDLDRTITREISGNALIRMAWQKGLIKRIDLLKAFYLYLLYKLGLRDPLIIINQLAGWVKGKNEDELKALCSDVFTRVLLPSVFSEAVKEIDNHKKQGANVIILSSALNPICNAMSESLGADGYICSSLEAVDGYLTGQPEGRLCFGDEKLNRLNGYCADGNIDKSVSWYYSDSISDLPVLTFVGNPVCVNPDSELKKEALKRGWKILRWKN
jgi:HAD superfamily hydrolase (TIGR01490 family)